MRNGQAARIATGVRLLHQLQVADHVLVVQGIAMKLFQQVKGDVGLVLDERIADDTEVVIDTNRVYVMPHLLYRRDDVPFRLPRRNFLRG